MRQGQQQNRRGRGRSGRKGQSPLSRSFESSGPDIKIRGTAQHIAEKYMALARDAIGSGDLVLGENYLQHAEHYNRIIMAAQTQPQNAFDQANGNGQRIARPEGDLTDSDGYEGDDEADGDQSGLGGGFDQPRSFEPNQAPREPQQHQGHQPRFRDNRNYDNRGNQPRSFEPRGQGGNDNRGYDQRRQEPREGYEPRYNDGQRSGNGSANGNPNPGGDQPHAFDQPRPPLENRDNQPGFEPRPQGDGPGPRGRRRRGRHENGANRPYPPQVGAIGGESEPAPANEPQPAVPHDGGDGNDGGAGGQS